MMPRFIYVNGEIYESEAFRSLPEIFLSPGFKLCDSAWFCNGQIPLFDEHLFYLGEQTGALGLKMPGILADKNELKRQWLRLINKNKAFHSGVLNIHLIWMDEGTDVIVSLMAFESNILEIKKEGVIAAFADNIKFSGNSFCPMDFYCHTFWEAVRRVRPAPRADGFIILNELGEVVEFAGGNIFFIKENTVFTPAPETGCWMPPLRQKILEAASAIEIRASETRSLNKNTVMEMDEAFFVSEGGGIRKLTGIGGKRFTHIKTAEIARQLNFLLTGR